MIAPMPTRSPELDPKPARMELRAALARALSLLPAGIPGGATRTLAARWLVLRDAAAMFVEREGLKRHLPPPPSTLSPFFAPDELPPIGATSLQEPDRSSAPAAFLLGEKVQQLLEWSIAPDGSPKPIGRTERRAAGAFYTPAPLVDRVVTMALAAQRRAMDAPARGLRVCDPSCGSGNFLSGVAAAMVDVPDSLWLEGADLDPLAAWAAVAALRIDVASRHASIHIRHGDALVGRLAGCEHEQSLADAIESRPLDWQSRFDLVIGNPPFLGQLTAATTRSRALAAYLKHASSGVISGYADAAAAFVWRSLMLCSPGGIIALIVPRSILATRDAASLRRFVDAHTEVVTIEPIEQAMFDAGIQPCILVLRRREEAIKAPSTSPSDDAWRFPGVQTEPAKPLTPVVTLGSICSATADFRDAYYGLRDFIIEDSQGDMDDRLFPRLITSGMIEPGHSLWGQERFRLYKMQWLRPRIDLARMQSVPVMHAWAAKRLVPKVLVATQTRTIECVADDRGEWLPVTPVISVVPHEGVWLSRIMDALSAPEASEVAARIARGTGMSAGVFRLSARQIGQLPLCV